MAETAHGNEALTQERESVRARRVIRIVFILFCVEVGLILLALPWTLLWDNNFFFTLDPQIRDVVLSPYTRGGVSGLGAVNLWIALSEAARLFR